MRIRKDVDYEKPEPEKPAESKDFPQTGDFTSLSEWLAVLLASLGVFSVLLLLLVHRKTKGKRVRS